MKASLLAIMALAVSGVPCPALTSHQKITRPAECPKHLRLKVGKNRRQAELRTVEITFTPREPELYRGRQKAIAYLTVTTGGKTFAKTRVALERDKDTWSGWFVLHPEAFPQSKLSLSTQLYERDGMATLGGGVVYEIPLAEFLAP